MLLVYCMSFPVTPLSINISIWELQQFVPINYYIAMHAHRSRNGSARTLRCQGHVTLFEPDSHN